MAYDGKVMREALQRFEEDKQRRASQAAARRQRIYREVPRLEEIEQQLRGTMGRIMAQALGGPEAYLRWSYINMLQETAGKEGRQTIYIPTEAGMPILEAGQRPAAR